MQEIIDNVRASFEIEDLCMTVEDRNRGEAILSGKKSIEEIIKELKNDLAHEGIYER